MTLMYEFDRKILNPQTRIPKIEFPGQGSQELEHYRHTNRQTDALELTTHSRMANMLVNYNSQNYMLVGAHVIAAFAHRIPRTV